MAGPFTLNAAATDSKSGKSALASAPVSVGTAGRFGATIAPATYGMANNQAVQAAQQLDGFIGQPLAMSAQRLYWKEATWTTPGQASYLAAAGVAIQACVKPSRTLSATEQTNLSNCVTSVLALGTPVEFTLWTEFNNNSAFNSPAAFQAYWNFYAPVILNAGGTVNFNPGCNGPNYAFAVEAFQGISPMPTRYYIDYYGNSWSANIFPDVAPSGVSSSMVAQADSAGLPFGFAEFGSAAGSSPPLTQPQLVSFAGYLSTLMYGRLKAGKVNANVLAYCSVLTGDNPANGISSNTDVKCPSYAQLYQSLSSAVIG